MNNNSYFYILWKTFLSSYSAIVGGISIFLGFVFWKYSPNNMIKLFPLILIITFLVFAVALFAKFSTILYSRMSKKSTVLKIIKPYGICKDEPNTVFALVTNHEDFTMGGIVSVFIVENGFEKQFAIGEIINIQEDKLVQLRVFGIIKEEITIEELLENNSDILKRLRVKPIIKLSSLEGLNYGK